MNQNISIDKLVEVLQQVKARDGIETITTFELLHILPGDEAVEHLRALDVAANWRCKCGWANLGSAKLCSVCGAQRK